MKKIIYFLLIFIFQLACFRASATTSETSLTYFYDVILVRDEETGFMYTIYNYSKDGKTIGSLIEEGSVIEEGSFESETSFEYSNGTNKIDTHNDIETNNNNISAENYSNEINGLTNAIGNALGNALENAVSNALGNAISNGLGNALGNAIQNALNKYNSYRTDQYIRGRVEDGRPPDAFETKERKAEQNKFLFLCKQTTNSSFSCISFGVNSINGSINGINGINGLNGVNGINGLNGVNGINGLNGVNSINSINGLNSKSYNNINVDFKDGGDHLMYLR